MTGKTILLVDDQELVLQSLKMALMVAGYAVEIAMSGTEALAKLEDAHLDSLITDWKMPGMTGEELALQAKSKLPQLPILLLTGYPPEQVSKAINYVMLKPFTVAELHKAARLLTS